MTLDLSRLGITPGTRATIYADRENKPLKAETVKLSSPAKTKAKVLPQGAWIAVIDTAGL